MDKETVGTFEIGNGIIVYLDDNGEIQSATQQEYHPEQIIFMLEVAVAKMKLVAFNMRIAYAQQQQEQQQRRIIQSNNISRLGG